MEKLDNYIMSSVDAGIIPGISYSIVTKNNIDIGAVGYKQIVPTKEPIDENALYDVASLTKVIVIVPLICKMIDEKKLDFKTKVKHYLPNFLYDDINIYHLLTHTSGLPVDFSSKEIISREKALKKLYTMEKEYETGSKVLYSDLGYMLLGELIEKLYDKPLNLVASEELFIPLEMNDTCYNPKNKERCVPTEVTDERGVVKGVVHDEKAYSLGGVSGHAGLFTTAIDISHFLSMIINDGKYNGKQIISKEMIDLWFKPLVLDKEKNIKRSFCWIIGVNSLVMKEGVNAISFTGYTGPSISIDCDKGIAICLLANRIHPDRDNQLYTNERPNITEKIYDICL